MKDVFVITKSDFDGVWYSETVFAVCDNEETAKELIAENKTLDLDYEKHTVVTKVNSQKKHSL